MKRFLVLLVGIIFIAAGAFLYYRNTKLQKACTEEAVAVVVDMKEELSTDNDDTTFMYYPIIEYKANDKTERVTMTDGSSNPKYNVNDKITILYNPNKTREFIVKGDSSSNIFSIVFMGLGVLVSGYGIYVALKKEN